MLCPFNHCIRGEAAREDENFVRAFCEKHALKLLSEKADVPAYADEKAFRQKQRLGNCVMTFLNVQGFKAEWDLLQRLIICRTMRKAYCCNFLRGSGLNGLCGMKYCSGKIIHPLLEFEKKELVEYLLQNGEQFQTDETNFVPDTARNLLRLKIIPEIRNGINSSCEKLYAEMQTLNEDENTSTALQKRPI